MFGYVTVCEPELKVKDLKKWFPAKSSPFSKEKVFIKTDFPDI